VNTELRLKNHVDGIPGEFYYISPVTETVIGPYHSFYDLSNAVKEHDKANSLPLTRPEAIEQQICARQPEVCRQAMDEEIVPEIDEKPVDASLIKRIKDIVPLPKQSPQPKVKVLTMKDVGRATKKMAIWSMKGRKKVDASVMVERAAVCMACPEHASSISGCEGCSGNFLRNAINLVVGNFQFPGYDRLGACAACGCALKAKVQLPIEYLKDRNEKLPDYCWINTES